MSVKIKKITFSVIVPAYNVAQYISQCIESVLIQTYKNFEMIIVNDGSLDNTLEICQSYAEKDKRIRVINKYNGGVSAARKDAVDVALGEYLFFLDADDWIEQGCFEDIYNVIRDKVPDIIFFGEFLGDSRGNFTSRHLSINSGFYDRNRIEKIIFPQLIQNKRAKCLSTSIIQKAVKKDLFKLYMLSNKDATIGEDGACLIPCIFHANSLFIIYEPYYYYRYNECSATKSRKIFNWSCPEIVNRHIEKHIDMKFLDFHYQMQRKIMHDVFNVVVTRFYQPISYFDIIKDIDKQLKNPYYQNAIMNASFAYSIKAYLMTLALRYRLYFLIYILSRIK